MRCRPSRAASPFRYHAVTGAARAGTSAPRGSTALLRPPRERFFPAASLRVMRQSPASPHFLCRSARPSLELYYRPRLSTHPSHLFNFFSRPFYPFQRHLQLFCSHLHAAPPVLYDLRVLIRSLVLPGPLGKHTCWPLP